MNIVAACVYIVCRQKHFPIMLIDISDKLAVNVYVLGKVGTLCALDCSSFFNLCNAKNTSSVVSPNQRLVYHACGDQKTWLILSVARISRARRKDQNTLHDNVCNSPKANRTRSQNVPHSYGNGRWQSLLSLHTRRRMPSEHHQSR